MTKKEKISIMLLDYITSDYDMFFIKITFFGKEYITSISDDEDEIYEFTHNILVNNFDDNLNSKIYENTSIKSAVFAYNENSIGRVREALSLNEEYFDTEGDEGVS